MTEILNGCLKGNRQAQKKFYEMYKDTMFTMCLRYADSRQDAEDILQDGFIKVFRDLHQYRGTGVLEGWVRRVILNVALQYIKKKKAAFVTDDLDLVSWKLQDESSVFNEEPISKGLIKLMHKLPPGFRTVLNLYVLEDYTHPQISEELGISVGTSKSQLNRAKALMKRMLEKNLTN